MADPPTPNPWDRQVGESTIAHDFFQKYYLMGPDRSLAKLGRKEGRRKSQLEAWSAKWRWVQRATAWDDHLARLKARESESETVKMARSHIQQSQLNQAALAAVPIEILRRVQEDPKFLQDLSREDLLSLGLRVPRSLYAAVVVERRARGLDVPKDEALLAPEEKVVVEAWQSPKPKEEAPPS